MTALRMVRNRNFLSQQSRPADEAADAASASGLLGTRAEAAQRLKVGVGGLLAVLLVVTLASSIAQMTRNSDQDTATPTAAEPAPENANDPLVDIGVAPELPGEQPVVQDLPAEQMPPETRGDAAPTPAGE